MAASVTLRGGGGGARARARARAGRRAPSAAARRRARRAGGPPARAVAPAGQGASSAEEWPEEGDPDFSEDDYSWYSNSRTKRHNKLKSFSDANFPTDPDGRVYHLQFRRGDVANRIISVGDVGRAEFLASMLEPALDGRVHKVVSSRGFVTHTGRYGGQPVSVIATLMGVSNMDMVVREARAVVDGEMVIVRVGTCGGLQPAAPVGTIVIASKGAASCYRNPDAFADDADSSEELFRFSKPIPADDALSTALAANMRKHVGETTSVVEGMNVTACSFYSSQGRSDAAFDDRNDDLTDVLVEHYPEAMSLEMETFHLLDMCRASRGSIRGSAAALVLAARFSNEFIDSSQVAEVMEKAGRAAFETVAAIDLDVPHGKEAYGDDCAWHA